VRVRVDIISAAKLGPENGPLEVEIPARSTLQDLIAELVALGGESLQKRLLRESDGQPYVMFVVNGEPIECADELHDGDEVLIVPPIGGG
jgi:molybdopterin converting factor small subunit